jgi:hypothetical protein
MLPFNLLGRGILNLCSTVGAMSIIEYCLSSPNSGFVIELASIFNADFGLDE